MFCSAVAQPLMKAAADTAPRMAMLRTVDARCFTGLSLGFDGRPGRFGHGLEMRRLRVHGFHCTFVTGGGVHVPSRIDGGVFFGA